MHAPCSLYYIKLSHVITHRSYLTLSFLGSSALASLSYVLCNAFFVFMDITGRPNWIIKYKIQKDKNIPVSIHLIILIVSHKLEIKYGELTI